MVEITENDFVISWFWVLRKLEHLYSLARVRIIISFPLKNPVFWQNFDPLEWGKGSLIYKECFWSCFRVLNSYESCTPVKSEEEKMESKSDKKQIFYKIVTWVHFQTFYVETFAPWKSETHPLTCCR